MNKEQLLEEIAIQMLEELYEHKSENADYYKKEIESILGVNYWVKK